jgi:hypothetical protein
MVKVDCRAAADETFTKTLLLQCRFGCASIRSPGYRTCGSARSGFPVLIDGEFFFLDLGKAGGLEIERGAEFDNIQPGGLPVAYLVFGQHIGFFLVDAQQGSLQGNFIAQRFLDGCSSSAFLVFSYIAQVIQFVLYR